MDDDPPQSGKRLAKLLAVFIFSAAALGAAEPTFASIPPVMVVLVLAVMTGILNLIFSLAQAGVSAVGPYAMEQLESEKSRLGKFLRHRFDHLAVMEQRFATAALLALFTMSSLLSYAGMLLAPGGKATGATLGVIVALIIHLAFVEVRSRGLALTDPLKTVRVMVPLAWLVSIPLLPLLWLGTLPLSRPKKTKSPTSLGDLHLRLLSSLGGVDGVMQEETFELIDSVRDFAEMTAVDIMTPRTELQAINENLSAPEIYERLRTTDYSRMIVYGESMDEIRGVLLAKEVLLTKPENPLSLLRDPIIASERASLSDLLSTIRKHQTHLIVIQDEYGGTSGIVTLHDLFESIVGHIDDSEDEEEFWFEEIATGTYRLNGRVEIWEVNDDLDLDLDEDVARTIGGYVFNTMGRVAEIGDEIEANGVRIAVAKKMENRIVEVLLYLPTAEKVVAQKPHAEEAP